MPNFICEPVTGRRMDIIEHIYSRCEVKDCGYETPCYIWQGGTTGTNHRGADYPKMSLDGQSVRVHRVVFVHFEGYLHSKRQVDHRCGSRLCVRYEHLRKATQRQNCIFRDQKNGVVRRKKRRSSKATMKKAVSVGTPSISGTKTEIGVSPSFAG